MHALAPLGAVCWRRGRRSFPPSRHARWTHSWRLGSYMDVIGILDYGVICQYRGSVLRLSPWAYPTTSGNAAHRASATLVACSASGVPEVSHSPPHHGGSPVTC